MNARKLVTRIALAGSLAATLAMAAPASAQPKKETKPKGCTVEVVDANGNTIGTKTVEVGTRIGLFVCGADGEWHFGWAVDGRVSPKAPKKHVATQATKVSRTRA